MSHTSRIRNITFLHGISVIKDEVLVLGETVEADFVLAIELAVHGLASFRERLDGYGVGNADQHNEKTEVAQHGDGKARVLLTKFSRLNGFGKL